MSLTFYYMNGCNFCDQAKQMFSDEIASREIIVKPSREAPPGTRGFPFFTANGKSHSGLPVSKAKLYYMLGVSMEKYEAPQPWWCEGVL